MKENLIFKRDIQKVLFGNYISERYYEKDGKLYCTTFINGYWNSQETTRKITKEDIERVVREEQDSHIQALAELNETLTSLKKMKNIK